MIESRNARGSLRRAERGSLILTEPFLQVSSLFRLMVASHGAVLHGLGVHEGDWQADIRIGLYQARTK